MDWLTPCPGFLEGCITTVIKLTFKMPFPGLFIDPLIKRQIIFLPVLCLWFVVRWAAGSFGICWRMEDLCQKVVLNRELACAREMIQFFKLWGLANSLTGFKMFGLRQVFQNI